MRVLVSIILLILLCLIWWSADAAPVQGDANNLHGFNRHGDGCLLTHKETSIILVSCAMFHGYYNNNNLAEYHKA